MTKNQKPIISGFELLREEPSSHFYENKNGLQRLNYNQRERVIPTTTTAASNSEIEVYT